MRVQFAAKMLDFINQDANPEGDCRSDKPAAAGGWRMGLTR